MGFLYDLKIFDEIEYNVGYNQLTRSEALWQSVLMALLGVLLFGVVLQLQLLLNTIQNDRRMPFYGNLGCDFAFFYSLHQCSCRAKFRKIDTEYRSTAESLSLP